MRLYSRIGRALLDAKQSGNDQFAAIDAIDLGLSKMAESCPGMTYAKLTWLHVYESHGPCEGLTSNHLLCVWY